MQFRFTNDVLCYGTETATSSARAHADGGGGVSIAGCVRLARWKQVRDILRHATRTSSAQPADRPTDRPAARALPSRLRMRTSHIHNVFHLPRSLSSDYHPTSVPPRTIVVGLAQRRRLAMERRTEDDETMTTTRAGVAGEMHNRKSSERSGDNVGVETARDGRGTEESARLAATLPPIHDVRTTGPR